MGWEDRLWRLWRRPGVRGKPMQVRDTEAECRELENSTRLGTAPWKPDYRMKPLTEGTAWDRCEDFEPSPKDDEPYWNPCIEEARKICVSLFGVKLCQAWELMVQDALDEEWENEFLWARRHEVSRRSFLGTKKNAGWYKPALAACLPVPEGSFLGV